MKHLFIINPAAGSRDRTGEYQQTIRRVCAGLDYRIAVSGAPGDCRRIARQAAETGEEYRIYCCGGDGTLNEVVSGVAGYENVAVTHYAGGSGNDFIKVFSDPQAFRDLERLLECQETAFDLIRCNEHYALNVCSIGLDARIGTDVAGYKRLPLLHGFRAYALSTIVNVIRGITEHYVVTVGGQTLDGQLTMICVCNGSYYGGGFHPVPSADPSDGILDVLVVRQVSRLKVAQVVGKYKAGRFAEYPELIRHYRTDRVQIRCDRQTPINLDGELAFADAMDIRLAGEKIRFFYPKGVRLLGERA